MSEEIAQRVLIALKKKYQENTKLDNNDIDILFGLTEDLLNAFITEKYK